MERTHRVRRATPGTVDIATTCERQAEAIAEMAYAEAQPANIPPTLRHQRLARMRPNGCPPWQRKRNSKSWTHRY
eukprot:5602538-Lingulodinium_polyedra.AAC.1